MAEEELTLYQLHDKEKTILFDEDLSNLMYKIMQINPIEKEKLFPWNDIGLADLFAECFTDTVLYCPEMKKWYVYNGEKWTKDEGAIYVNKKLQQFAELMMLYCIEMNADDKLRTAYTNFIGKLGNRNIRERVLKDAQSSMTFSINKFDADPYLLNCRNGTYDLKTGTYHEFRAKDYLTLQTNCDCPTKISKTKFDRWYTFIDEIMCEDKELAKYLQKALGYSLLGIANEECMFIAYGQTTRNGKGTLLNTIQKVLGDYGGTIDVNFICRSKLGRNYASANPMVCGLKACRFLTMNESDDGSKLDESLIKNYTGGDPISTRELYGTAFSFTPQFTMWLSANTLPDIYDKSIFSSERVKVIPFNRHFNKEEQDPDLKQKFLTEEAKTTIFQWLLDGYELYTKEGLNNPPVSVASEVEQYEKDNDITALFLEDKCEMKEDEMTLRNALYSTFKNWCNQNGVQSLKSSQKFYKDLERLGIEQRRRAEGWYIVGVIVQGQKK